MCWQSNGVFDAKALLTSDSITNDSLLAWTISGTGPASVDSTGLVSFGSGPGSYLVQVTDRSNAVCAPSLVLDVVRLEFVTNAATVCWQSNGTCNAKALLTSDSTTNDSLLAWTITGTGPATIDSAGLVSLGSGSGSYTVQVAGRSNGVCAVSLALDVLRVEFVTNAASMCWQSNGVFDAQALLTSGSTTNDSLLAWTITGTGPATIDSAGVVSLGSGSGSYTVQVAGWSNAVCAAGLTLEVIKLELASPAATVCWQSNGVFDAKALLTADSITNDSLLAWTITGTGPASIDSTGLVSFGPEPGSYTVQVTDRSNAVCAPSLVLDVLRLEFVTNAATVCWQSNGTFNARALLTSDSTTNDSLLAWTITGTGPASIDSAGLVSVGSTSGSYTVQVAGRSNAVCAVSLALDVIKLALVTNAAMVCWQSNGVFDAKALLTADSITNDSLLTWTITGTGPASIDSAGLVSFGPGPGSYLVQVTDRSNAVCAPSLVLDVLRLEFVTNAATVCWQSNGTFNARALLTSDSTTNDSLLAWTIVGSGPATIDGVGLGELGFRLGQLHSPSGRAEQRGVCGVIGPRRAQAGTGQPCGDGVLAEQRGL